MFNGYMLGVFLEMSLYDVFRKNFGYYHRRMQTFFDEIGFRCTIPKNVHAFVMWRLGLYDRQVLPQLKKRSSLLASFCELGRLSVEYRISLNLDRKSARKCADDARRIFDSLNLPFSAFDGLALKTRRRFEIDVNEIMTPVLKLLTDLLRDLKPEPRTCFIAMPFRNRFERFYSCYYRPMLFNVGYRPLRAWGGFGKEDFLPLLAVAILKSGATLADISAANPNVMWELGVAQGSGKLTVMLGDLAGKVPSDFGNNSFVPYRVMKDGKWKPRVRKLADWGVIQDLSTAMTQMLYNMERISNDKLNLLAGVREKDVKEGIKKTIKLLKETVVPPD